MLLNSLNQNLYLVRKYFFYSKMLLSISILISSEYFYMPKIICVKDVKTVYNIEPKPNLRSWVWVLGTGSKILDSRCWALGLDLESQVLGSESYILSFRFQVLGSSSFRGCYKVWQKVITKCDR